MKNIFLAFIFLFQSLALWAQPNSKNTLVINDGGLKQPIEIRFTSDKTAIINTVAEKITIPVSIKGNEVVLTSKEDENRFLQKVAIDTNALDKVLSSSSSRLEQLLNKAYALDPRVLYISNTEINGESEEFVQAANATGENVSDSSKSNWIWWIALPLVGIIIGFVLGKMNQSKPVAVNEIEVDEEFQTEINTIKNDAPAPVQERKTKTNVNINQLKTKYDKLREDSKVLKQSYSDLRQQHKELKQNLDADMQYYKAAYIDIIVPLQNALDKGNLAEIFKYITIASTQYSAITRAKLVKKQNYDITNINTLLKNNSDHANFPVISSETPVDKTPQQLQQVVSILKQLGVKDLDNYILQGYKLNNI